MSDSGDFRLPKRKWRKSRKSKGAKSKRKVEEQSNKTLQYENAIIDENDIELGIKRSSTDVEKSYWEEKEVEKSYDEEKEVEKSDGEEKQEIVENKVLHIVKMDFDGADKDQQLSFKKGAIVVLDDNSDDNDIVEVYLQNDPSKRGSIKKDHLEVYDAKIGDIISVYRESRGDDTYVGKVLNIGNDGRMEVEFEDETLNDIIMDEICHVETDRFNKALYATNKLFTKLYEAR